MMLTKMNKGNKWEALKVTTAKLMFKSNAADFINDYGKHWFFCECKTKRIEECEAMS